VLLPPPPLCPQLRTGGDDTMVDINITTPCVGMMHRPGQTWGELKQLMHTTVLPDHTSLRSHWDNPKYPYRAFKCPFAPKPVNGLPPTVRESIVEPREFPRVKFIAIAREGKDVVHSFQTFFGSHDDRWRGMWNYPPGRGASAGAIRSTEDSLEFLTRGEGKEMYFGYVNAWWQYRHDANVLLLHYADLVRDLESELRKVAAFVGVNVDQRKWAGVVERCRFPWMKKHQIKFHHRIWGFPEMDATGFRIMKNVDGVVIRNGTNGDSQGHFTPQMLKKWEAAAEDMLPDPSMRAWAAKGRPDFFF
jgi:hypothetical protein